MLFKKVFLINLSICLLVLFFFLNGNESNGKVRLFLPEKTWVMEVNIEGFKLEENLLSFDGESRRFFVSNENKNLFMSVFLEKAEGLWDSKDYREYYWNEYKRNTAKNKELPEPEEIRIWEEGEKAMLEYINKEFEGIKIIPSNEEEEELIFPVGESDWAEYKVENKLKAMDIKGMAGVAVRYNEDGSGYFIWVKPEERVEIEEELSKWDKKVFKKDKVKRTILKSCRLILEKRGGGKGEIIIERLFMLKRWWEVKIEVDIGDGRILVKVDGEPITEISDEIKSGKIALIAKPKHFSPFSGSYEGNLVIRREATEEEKGKESKELGYFISDWRWGLGGPSDYPLHYSYSEPDSEGAILYQTTTSLPPNEIVYYYHHDHLGNIRAVTDSNGNVVERHDFYPFGEEISQSQSKDQYLFTGKPRDLETGLDYFGARYYSSSLSRWLSADQITDLKRNIENPQRWNLYIYVLNNPIKFLDLEGNEERVSFFIMVDPAPPKINAERLMLKIHGAFINSVSAYEPLPDIDREFYLKGEATSTNFIKELEKSTMVAFLGHSYSEKGIAIGLIFSDATVKDAKLSFKGSIIFLAACRTAAENSKIPELFGINKDTKGAVLVGFAGKPREGYMASALQLFSKFLFEGYSVKEAVEKTNKLLQQKIHGLNIKAGGRKQYQFYPLTIIGDANVSLSQK
jgi:RHS repeat-associated protein